MLAERERERVVGSQLECCQVRKAGKRKPLPFETEGKGWSIEPGRKDRRQAILPVASLVSAVNEGVVDQGVARPDQHLDRDIAG